MTTKARRRPGRLKLAIVESGRTQRRIAIATRIPEMRLSRIVRGELVATPAEQKRLARYLDLPIVELFPSPEASSDDTRSAP